MDEIEVEGETNINHLLSVLPYDQWAVIKPNNSRPAPRYKHVAEIVMDKLYVIGGSRNGRYLSDIKAFDLRTLKWSSVSLNQAFPATAGHSVVAWRNKLLIVAGNSKVPSETVTVWLFDIQEQTLSAVETNGQIPIARAGQSISLVGSHLIMFGGEDTKRRLLNDLFTLNLETMTWEEQETKRNRPAPRYDHAAAVYADQYLLIFGGSSHSNCYNDLHVLDLESMEWTQLETPEAIVAPRSGHASTLVNEYWYIVGGGDNANGSTDTLAFNTSNSAWSVVTSVAARDALASEGLTLCSTVVAGENLLISFGGYNGNYNNEIFVMKLKPRSVVKPRLVQSPAAAAAAASVTSAYAATAADDERTIHINVSHDITVNGTRSDVVLKETAEIDALNEEKSKLNLKLTEITSENVRLKDTLDAANLSYNELTKELNSVQTQLAAEGSRCQKLEMQIATARSKLESVSSLEREVVVLRKQISQLQQNMTSAPAQRRKSGGVWGWVAGGTEDSEDE